MILFNVLCIVYCGRGCVILEEKEKKKIANEKQQASEVV